MRRRIARPICALLVWMWMGGCGQVLGLGNYGEAPDAEFADASLDVVADGSVGDGARIPSSDAISDVVPEFALDGDLVADSQSAGEGAIDAFGASPDAAGDAATAGDTYAVEAQALEASTDASIDTLPSDTGVDAFVCPPECNSGCGDGGTCVITVTNSTGAPVNCPPDLACQVHCLGQQVCGTSINCASGQPCLVTCEGRQACTANTINQGDASSLCVDCLSGGGFGGGSCSSVSCSSTMCSLHCSSGCGGSCANCARVFACP